MNRYDHHFRMWEPHFRTIPLRRVGAAKGALFKHRNLGFGPEDDEAIVRQFDLSGMAEFWDIALSEPMTCGDFARSLASHFFKIEDGPGLTDEERLKLGPAAERVVDSVKAGIRQALRAARSYGEPWFTAIPEPPPSTKLDPKAWMGFVPSDVVFVPPDPPADGIDLNKLRVQPRAAVEWMLSSAQRRHLVPPSLVTTLRGVTVAADAPSVLPIKPQRGRKKGTGYQKADEPLARRMLEMTDRGEAQSLSEAARVVIGPDGKAAKGVGELEAKVERLVKVANALSDTERNRE